MNNPVRILYLEDNPRDADLVRHALEQTGMALDLRIANDRAAYEAAMDQTRLDLILSDYSLPAYDGMAALALARMKQPDVPFILVSGTLGEEQAVDCVLRGATDFVLKYRMNRLVPAVIRALSEAEERERRRQAEKELRESEARYRTMFENAIVGISQALLDGHLISANRAYAEMYGFASPAAMMSEAPNVGPRYASPEDRLDVLRILRDKGVMAPREMSVVRRDGSRFDVLVAARAIKDAAGNLLFYQAEHVDVTKHKQAEMALRESEDRYRQLFEALSDGIMIVDSETKAFLHVNPALCRFLGYTAKELTALHVTDVHPREALPAIIAGFEAAGRVETTGSIALPCLRKDGRVVYADVNSNTVMLAGRKCNIAIFRDITERRWTGEQMAKQLDELRRWQTVTLGREGRIGELKREVNELAAKLGVKPRYASVETLESREDANPAGQT